MAVGIWSSHGADAVAGWLGSNTGEDSSRGIAREVFVGEVGRQIAVDGHTRDNAIARTRAGLPDTQGSGVTVFIIDSVSR